ncbi:MAG: RNA-binding transcriptional accessory protein [Clostridiales bacterium]|jgi:uncharacterized protein|nr:RNA-binding transcriptional accessory protein [Clostridiales bacterium]
MNLTSALATQFQLQEWQVEQVVTLLEEGNTIPFIARYRKEAHGSLDDQTIRELSERLDYLRSLEKRKEEVSHLIGETGHLTEDVAAALEQAATLSEIDDIYRPYRPKRKTRASIAKAKGLEPLADLLLEQNPRIDPVKEAATYCSEEQEVATAEDALAGAQDILAERMSDDPSIRKRLRVVAFAQGLVQSKATNPEEDSVYAQYYTFSQPAEKIAGHRVLAMDRGEREGFLKVSIELEKEKGLQILFSSFVKGNSASTQYVRQAAEDSYSRLIFPSIEREIRAALTEQASEQAIKVFAVNLRQLLMQPPVKGRVTIGLDPGYRTGCKIAVVDATGRVLDTGVIYPTHSKAKIEEAKRILRMLIEKHQATVIAIGNGTASRETERFTVEIIAEMKGYPVQYMIVSEAGASVYSASKLAAEEFPDFDVTLRSAVSIARRLQDPLAELVKIDPKAIGVGQYQHDMPKKRMDEALGGVVEDCVNTVGVDLNTASPSLLEQIAGISGAVSKNIVAYREENGAFQSRKELKKVPKLGPKAFEQCAGFLRISESENILDNTAVHPESYEAAEALLSLCGYQPKDLASKPEGLKEKLEVLNLSAASEQLGVGVPTLEDIRKELLRPGRDPREELPPPLLRTDVLEMKDLKPGMELDGTVRNVIDFGAFVDIGVHQDGLVHLSQICDRYIKHPSEIVKVGDIVHVTVLSVDLEKKRISLTMKK